MTFNDLIRQQLQASKELARLRKAFPQVFDAKGKAILATLTWSVPQIRKMKGPTP